MQPSSLIFLVIIGIWAAYFVQYWVRRREHLATLRSVNAFSETMRVLQLRAPLPTVDTGGQAPRTYAVSPARATRPQVTVKRAEAHAMQPDRGARPVMATTGAAARLSPRPDTAFVAAAEREVASMRPSRSTRAVVLLVGVLGAVVFSLLATFGVLVAWSPLIPLVMAAAGFAWLRAGVQSEIRARRAAQQRSRRPAPRRDFRADHAPGQHGRVVQPQVAAPAVEDETDRDRQHEVRAEALAQPPFDVSATAVGALVEDEVEQPATATFVDQPAAQHEIGQRDVVQGEMALPELDEDDIPLTWDPRPVPRPTYTMKARAAERPAPAAPAQVEADTEHTAYDDLPQRRIVGG